MRLTPADHTAWATYLAANARAAEQYVAMPISYNQAGPASDCLTCGARTKARDGACRACRRAS